MELERPGHGARLFLLRLHDHAADRRCSIAHRRRRPPLRILVLPVGHAEYNHTNDGVLRTSAPHHRPILARSRPGR